MASPFLPPNESNWAITVVKEHTEKAQTTDSKRIRRNMELITKGRMTAKVQSKLVELVSIVKLIENLLFSPKIPKFMELSNGLFNIFVSYILYVCVMRMPNMT